MEPEQYRQFTGLFFPVGEKLSGQETSLSSQTHFCKRGEGFSELRIQAVSHWNAINLTRFQIMHPIAKCAHSPCSMVKVFFTAPVVAEKLS